MTNPTGGVHGMRKVFLAKVQSHVDQGDEHRHFDQGADNCGKGLTGVDTENRNGYGNGQFKVVGSGRKAQRGGLFVGRPSLGRKAEGDQEHGQKVDAKRNGDTHHVHGKLHDVFTLERKHDQNGEKEKDQGKGADTRQQFF